MRQARSSPYRFRMPGRRGTPAPSPSEEYGNERLRNFWSRSVSPRFAQPGSVSSRLRPAFPRFHQACRIQAGIAFHRVYVSRETPGRPELPKSSDPAVLVLARPNTRLLSYIERHCGPFCRPVVWGQSVFYNGHCSRLGEAATFGADLSGCRHGP